MKKLARLLILILTAAPLSGIAQAENDPFNYGLGLHFNVPVFKPLANDTLGVKAGWGASLFFENHVSYKWGWRVRSGFDQSRYLNDIDNTTTIFNSGSILGSALFFPERMSETQFEFGLTGNYSFSGVREILDGTKQNGVRTERYKPPVRTDIGLCFGIAFELKPQYLLRFSYTEYILSKQYSSYMDGRPDQFQVALDIRFNRLSDIATSDDYRVANEQLDDLASGKLIFMLSTRGSELRSINDPEERARFISDLEHVHKSLVSAIHRYYNYSDFLICYDTAVSEFAAGNSYSVFLDSTMQFVEGTLDGSLYYAHVGENFYSEYRRSSTGIYIYDKDLVMLKYPFPYFTKYKERSDERFGAFNLESMVKDLNKSLFDQKRLIGTRFMDNGS